MRITTKSGKTIKVDDRSYRIDLGENGAKHVFTSAQEGRMYTIDESDIEIFDENLVDETLAAIIGVAERVPTSEPTITGYV